MAVQLKEKGALGDRGPGILHVIDTERMAPAGFSSSCYTAGIITF